MEQGVTFLNGPHGVPMPYELTDNNHVYVQPKKLSVNDYTNMMGVNTKTEQGCHGGVCTNRSVGNTIGLHSGIGNIKTDHNTGTNTGTNGHTQLSSCYDNYMHIQKCMICSSVMRREKYILYVLIVIAVLLLILIFILCKK